MSIFFTATTAAAPSTQSTLSGIVLPFVLMIAIFYFLLIRPQQKQQKERQAFLGGLKKGDKVVTVGGLYGEITELKDDVVTLKIAEKVEVKLAKAGISHRVNDKK